MSREADEDAEAIACGNYLLNTLDQSKLAAYTASSSALSTAAAP